MELNVSDCKILYQLINAATFKGLDVEEMAKLKEKLMVNIRRLEKEEAKRLFNLSEMEV
jgi:hypothetical protein